MRVKTRCKRVCVEKRGVCVFVYFVKENAVMLYAALSGVTWCDTSSWDDAIYHTLHPSLLFHWKFSQSKSNTCSLRIPHYFFLFTIIFLFRISATLKAKWEDPDFREKMLTRSFTRTDEWRALVSDRIRAKWSDPEYRAAVAVGKTTDNIYHV